MSRPPTGTEALRTAIPRLAAAGVPDPARDARLLLAHATRIPPDRLTLRQTEALLPEAASRFAALVAARAARQPVSQIIGQRLFWGRNFRVTADVLDPRPETEVLVAEALSAPFARVLDLGTGSGAILCSLLADRPAATGIGTDISAPALAIARGNAQAMGLGDRAAFVLSDWFVAVTGRFDLIVANPPYIAAAEMAALAPEVRDWEPHIALTPGGDGLGSHRLIAAGAGRALTPAGRIFVEHGPTQGYAVAALFAAAGLQAIRILRDLDGRDRAVVARTPG